MEVDPTTEIVNETGENINLATIITCTTFVITGQCIARLLETFHHHHNFYWSLHDGIWTQPFLQVIGFPLLLLPFFFLSSRKHNQLLITSKPYSLSLLYICTGITMLVQVRLYVKGKLESPFNKFLLLDGSRIYLTPIFAAIIKRIKFNVWMVISLVYTIAITTLSSYVGGELSALLSAFTFIFLLGNIEKTFDVYISKGNKKVKPIFADVLEILIFSSLCATLAAVFISGENHDLMREMEGFPKGKIVYVMTMVGQVAAWQIYWVGIVGLVVFAESIVTSNIVSFSPYPIIMVLEILFFNYEDDEFDGYLGAALVLSAFMVVNCLYKTRHVRRYEISKRSRFFLVLVSVFVHHLYISELLTSDPYISPPTAFDFY
ncbi:hypothetical protein Bca4012_064142 [Brassica carinata]|uniref:Probable purine permease n=1 Tax=Brassica carinata TaxID=52824 RepID=A0A8X7SJ91_BRACI|nr:hypothetical protein Bca52824_033715 [Brassica carinata]